MTTTDPLAATIRQALVESGIFDSHRLGLATRSVLAVIAESGRLLPEGGVTEVQRGWSHRDGTECTNDEHVRFADERRVTTWPDGTELVTPWSVSEARP